MRVLTILVNLCTTAILSKNLSLGSYGTFASANLVISFFTNITQMGLMDGVNYYYQNISTNRRDSVNTIFLIQICIGVVCGTFILGTQRAIVNYFNNPQLALLLVYIAFRPMLGNLFNSMMVLQIAVGNAKVVAVRHAIVAMMKLLIILLTSYVTKNVATIFIAQLILDCATIGYFYYLFGKKSFWINPLAAKLKLIRPILFFAIPMGIYVMTNSLSRDVDKLVIGYFENKETLAIYTNCATLLPFDFVSAAFLTIVIPVMTRLVKIESMIVPGIYFNRICE